ncbi:MAG: hypothetical protein AB7F09_06585 [Parvibaculaceae bacterium]
MRVSSNAPALSRRSMMRGLAFALAGACVPVAAIGGMTARKLTEAPNRCQPGRKLKPIEKRSYMVDAAHGGDGHA